MDHPGWTANAVFESPDGGGTPPLVKLPTISGFSTSAAFAQRTYNKGKEDEAVQLGFSSTPASVWDEYWGVDTRYVGTDRYALAYSDPRKTGELMSYVNGGGSTCAIDQGQKGQGYWVSPETYAYLRQHLMPGLDFRVEAPGDQVMGSMSTDAGGTHVDMGPMIDVPYIDMERSNDLGFMLNLYDGAGELIAAVAPDVDFALGEGESEDATLYGVFIADFPRHPVFFMDLVQDDVVLS